LVSSKSAFIVASETEAPFRPSNLQLPIRSAVGWSDQTAVLNFTPNGEQGAVWQSGAGPAADPEGNVYVMAANGTFDTTLNSAGFPAR
jgi:hypothetical protein